MHQGIDIGVPSGTPIHAAAAGTVIYCGWEEGYGNFVVIDHGGNLATAYGHQSSIAVACGQQVAQGQVIGYAGCTGHCTGPHVHFEVRINGNPVDPMGYLLARYQRYQRSPSTPRTKKPISQMIARMIATQIRNFTTAKPRTNSTMTMSSTRRSAGIRGLLQMVCLRFLYNA